MGWGEPIAGPGGAELELRFPSLRHSQSSSCIDFYLQSFVNDRKQREKKKRKIGGG